MQYLKSSINKQLTSASKHTLGSICVGKIDRYMAHYQNHYGDSPGRSADDEYGNPINYNDQGSGAAIPTGRSHRQGLRRTGSSSSSSSSDDENGVRRQKGMKEKIKEKIPGVGGYPSRAHHASSTTTPGGSVSSEQRHDKKGFMDKIKEKLPGQN